MGGCLSYNPDGTTRHRNPAANLITVAGELHRYSIPSTVSEVLQSETCSPNSFFICNSDHLYFDNFMPSLDLEDDLEAEQIYFLLPVTMLRNPLAASDLAALAVKASVALDSSNRRRNRRARVSPVMAKKEGSYSSGRFGGDGEGTRKATATLGVSRSGSRKLRRFRSRRGKYLAVGSFKIGLTTINEGSVLFN